MARLAYALLLLRFTEAAPPTYIMEELYGDEVAYSMLFNLTLLW